MKLTDDNAIDIQYEAETDKPTIVNMTNHSYFNLEGDAGNNSGHLLMVDADYYTPVDSTFMTTGEIVPVEGTPMDFRTPTPVGERINDYDFVQLKNGNGYDHNWVLNTIGDVTRKCASLKSPKTGIVLDVYTNEPGIQVYAGNFLDGSLTGKKGITFTTNVLPYVSKHRNIRYPNKPEWPSAVLPGRKVYKPMYLQILCCLELQRDGLTGHLGEISAWLEKDNNAWLTTGGDHGWEEVPYWLKGYGNLAYILNDPKMIAETKTWIEGVFASCQPDGYFRSCQRTERQA